MIRGLRNKIRLCSAGQLVNIYDFDFSHCESILVIGAGGSASPEAVEEISKHYDLLVTIGSAFKIYPDADFYSFEFAFKNSHHVSEQLRWINEKNFKKFLIKPHSVAALSKEDKKKIKVHLRALKCEATGGDGRETSLGPMLKGIKHHVYPVRSDVNDYLDLLHDKRPPMQWRGSLSLWLDMVYLNPSIKLVGLIGTDLGGEYSSLSHPFEDMNSTTHPTNRDMSNHGGRPPILDILKFLTKSGYLENVCFNHYHSNAFLKNIL